MSSIRVDKEKSLGGEDMQLFIQDDEDGGREVQKLFLLLQKVAVGF